MGAFLPPIPTTEPEMSDVSSGPIMPPMMGGGGDLVIGEQDPLAGIKSKLSQMHSDFDVIGSQYATADPQVGQAVQIGQQAVRMLISRIVASARVGATEATSPVL